MQLIEINNMKIVDCNDLNRKEKTILIKSFIEMKKTNKYYIHGKTSKKNLNNNVEHFFINDEVSEYSRYGIPIKWNNTNKLKIPNSVKNIFIEYHIPIAELNFIIPKSVELIIFNCFHYCLPLEKKYLCGCCINYVSKRNCICKKFDEYIKEYYFINENIPDAYDVKHIICKKCFKSK